MLRVGTKLSNSLEVFQNSVRELITATTQRMELSSDFIEIHNIYTAYTSLLLFHATGHRPVVDPFCYQNDMDLINQFIIVEDKVTVESNRLRLSALPSIAIEQINAYKNHLKWVLSHLVHIENCEALSYQIADHISESKPKKDRVIPFLFFLKRSKSGISHYSVSEKYLKSILNNDWLYPINMSRHLISTSIRAITLMDKENNSTICPIQIIPLIEQSLGHNEGIVTPFSKGTVLSPLEFVETINKHMDQILNKQGWKTINSKRHNIELSSLNQYRRLKFTAHSKMGPIIRTENRLFAKNNDKNIVRHALEKFTIKDIEDNPIIIESIRNNIINASEDAKERLNHRLLLLWKLLIKIQRKNKNIKLPSRLIILNKEPSPLTESTINDYTNASIARSNFLKYIEDNGKTYNKDSNRPSFEKRMAEIIISAALFDCVNNIKSLEFLTKNRPTITTEVGYSFYDIQETKKERTIYLTRWIMQPLSISLVGSLKEYDNINEINDKEIIKELKYILKTIYRKNIKSPLNTLIHLAQSYWLVHLPPYLREISQGTVNTTPFKENTLIRVLRNCRLKAKNSIQEESNEDLSGFNFDSLNNTKNTLSSSKTFSSYLSDTLTKAKEHIGHKGQSASKSKKEYLIAKLENTINKNHNFPIIGIALLQWGIKLAIKGTDLNGPIVFNTVSEYLSLISNALLDITAGNPFIKNSSDYYDMTYQLIIESSTYNNNKLINNLKDFHRFLQRAKLVPEIDWSPLHTGEKSISQANAIIITPDEYAHCIRSILELEENGELEKKISTYYCFMIFFGYRFGLRISEALYLKFENIQMPEQEPYIVIHARNSEYNDTKSDAGVREIPLIGVLSKNEEKIVSRLLSLKHSSDYQDLIFASEHDPSEIIDEYKTRQFLIGILRHVTGDIDVIFHSLRHSFVNRVFSLLIKQRLGYLGVISNIISDQENYNNAVTLLTGHPDRHHIIFDAITSLVGHTVISTTFTNYIHITDFIIYKYCSDVKHWPSDAISNTDNLLSYATLMSSKSVAKKRQRHSISPDDIRSSLVCVGDKYSKTRSEIKTTSSALHPFIATGTEKKQDTVNLMDIENILLHYSIKNIIDVKLSPSHLFLEQSKINRILETFNNWYKISGYMFYNVDMLLLKHKSEINKSSRSKESKAIKKLLPTYSKLIERFSIKKRDIMKEGVKSWADSYHSTSKFRPLVFDSPESLIKYFNLLSLLNIVTKYFSISIPDAGCNWLTHENNILSIHQGNKTYTYIVKKIKINNKSIPMGEKYTRSSQNRIGVSFERTSKHPIYFQIRLDRLIFLIGIQLFVSY